SGRIALEMAVGALRLRGVATPHDEVVAKQLAIVLSGGERADITEPLSDDDLLKLERQAFMTLVRQPATLARIEHMLDTGKPLRN
ncbi:MAG TPA: 3-hydroxyacyl-CoA dehydrogenase, partial [Geminicoccaceae bacterium]|nr:3-hydroxyacyl-CoA dehydrogenase [Geminicoccaceae bacterium]